MISIKNDRQRLASADGIPCQLDANRAKRASRNNMLANPVRFLFRVAFLTLLVIMWGGIIMDQLPCFLGVPNCD